MDKWLPNKRFISSHSPPLDAKPYDRWAGEQFGEQHHAGSDVAQGYPIASMADIGCASHSRTMAIYG